MSVNYRTGINQFLKFGTGATATTYAGRVTGGEIAGDSGLVWRPSVGGKAGRGYGMWRGGGRATIEVADATLLNYFQRSSWTSPAMTALTFEGGTSSAGEAFTQTGCYINELELAMAVGDPLSATIAWLAGNEAPQAAPSIPTPAATHWEWFQGGCTILSSTRHLQRLSISVSNGLDPLSSIETKTTNSLRLPEGFKIGYERVTFSATMLEYPGTALWQVYGDNPTAVVTLSATVTDGTHTLTASVAAGSVSTARMPFEAEDGAVLWDISGECTPNESTAFTLSYS